MGLKIEATCGSCGSHCTLTATDDMTPGMADALVSSWRARHQCPPPRWELRKRQGGLVQTFSCERCKDGAAPCDAPRGLECQWARYTELTGL